MKYLPKTNLSIIYKKCMEIQFKAEQTKLPSNVLNIIKATVYRVLT